MDMRHNGEKPTDMDSDDKLTRLMSSNTRLQGHDSGSNDIALDVAEVRDHLNKMVEINKRISAKAPQVGKTLREYTNILMRITERWK